MPTGVRSESRPIPSDATLVWLASERAAPLFRTLDRTRAFGPLVVLLATLPAVLATFGEMVTPADAAWGLRALDATGSAMPAGVVAAVETAVPAEVVRPLPLWLSAGLMRLAGPALPVSGSLASLLGGALLLGVLWPLAKSLSGRRLAFWAVLLAAFHPTLTELLRLPVPVTLGLAASAAALWGSLNLDGKPLRLALISLGTVAAITFALAVEGPVALAAPAAVAIDAVLALFLTGRNSPQRPSARGAASPTRSTVRRLSAALAAVAVWAVLEGLGPDYVPGHDAKGPVETEAPSLDAADPSIIGPLWGLAAIGLGRLLRVVHRRAAARSPRPVPRLVLVWLAVAGAAVLWRGTPAESGFDPAGRYAVAFAALPVLLAAAYAIEEASRRTVSGAWVLLAVALPLAVRLGTLMAAIRTDAPLAWVSLAAVGVAVLWLVTRVIPAAGSMPGFRRGMLMAAILLAVGVNGGDGAAVLLEGGSGTDHYRRLVARLRDVGPADAVVLVADSPPLELAFGLRASFPRSEAEITPTWDEAAAFLRRLPGAPGSAAVIAAWGVRGGGAGPAEELHPAGGPLLFGDRELLIYTTLAGGNGQE